MPLASRLCFVIVLTLALNDLLSSTNGAKSQAVEMTTQSGNGTVDQPSSAALKPRQLKISSGNSTAGNSTTGNRTAGNSTTEYVVTSSNITSPASNGTRPVFIKKTVKKKEVKKKEATVKKWRIVGGSTASKEDMPWQAAVVYWGGGTSISCGGTVICKKFVLTAQHCTTNPEWSDPSWIEVLVGLSDLSITENRKGYLVKKYHNHPQFKQLLTKPKNGEAPTYYYKYDVALLELKKAINIRNLGLKSVLLPRPKDRKRIKAGDKLVVSGWGAESWENSQDSITSEKLMGVTIPFVPNKKCGKIYEEPGFKIREDMICAGGEKGKDSCQGDSGGPLTWLDPMRGRMKLVGVVSYGLRCAENYPGVYADMTHKPTVSWVKKVTKNCNAKLCKAKGGRLCVNKDNISNAAQKRYYRTLLTGNQTLLKDNQPSGFVLGF